MEKFFIIYTEGDATISRDLIHTISICMIISKGYRSLLMIAKVEPCEVTANISLFKYCFATLISVQNRQFNGYDMVYDSC